jgi:putative transposase
VRCWGIRLVHSRPGQPAGRGKIERFFATVRSQFLIEVAPEKVADLEELNRLFLAWTEQRYHCRTHSETGQTPLERFTAAGITDLPIPELLREAFLWAEDRTVTKTALVALHGNHYQVDPVLIGRKVQLIFDPFDLTEIEVRWHDQTFGIAAPHHITTRVHPRAAAGITDPDDMPAVHSGIDYLALVAAEHEQAIRRPINFAELTHHDDQQHADRAETVEGAA